MAENLGWIQGRWCRLAKQAAVPACLSVNKKSYAGLKKKKTKKNQT